MSCRRPAGAERNPRKESFVEIARLCDLVFNAPNGWTLEVGLDGRRVD